MSARKDLYGALWDNYTPDQKNAFIDAALAEHNTAEYGNLRAAVWDWIISVNNGSGLDVEDLMAAMDQLGATCPEGLVDDE